MAFFGKVYTCDRQENVEEFAESLKSKVPEPYRQIILTSKPTTKFLKNGESYTLVSGSAANNYELPFTSGVEYDDKVLDKAVKSKFTVEGNTITQVQNFVDSNVVITYKREFNGDELVTTLSNNVWDGVARRIYKA